MCDDSTAVAVCGVPIAQIRAGIDAGDEFVVPFCLRELTTILALLRTWGLHPDNIDENLNPRHLSNVAIEAARSGTLYTTIQGTTAATQTYIVAQYERLVRALVDFAYLHNAIVLRNGVYSWDNDRLPLWTHRPAAVEQWLKSKGCPIGPHHFVRPVHWVMASMDGFKRHPAGRSDTLGKQLRRQLTDLVEYLDKVHNAGYGKGVGKTIRALRRLASDDL